jgi:hypothetical protein
MGYEANGVGDLLFDDIRLRLDADPQSLSFVILFVSLSPSEMRLNLNFQH